MIWGILGFFEIGKEFKNWGECKDIGTMMKQNINMSSHMDKQYSASLPKDHPQSDIYRDRGKGCCMAIRLKGVGGACAYPKKHST